MSGRFAGSKSVDDRRRRRLAADDTQPTAVTAGAAAEKPLPSRRPTGRFPLRRIVSRSTWKLAGVGLAALVLGGAALAAGYVPAIAGGAYGPGVAALCSAESERLPTALSGLLLIASGQLAWLIRWARARSLRDFRGSYRVWWWAALALMLGGVTQLTEAHLALASTLVWLTGRTPLGSDVVFRLSPTLAALVVLLPSLQRDMRECRTSRTFLLIAAALWLTGGVVQLAPEFVGRAIQSLEPSLPVAALTTGLSLAGTVSAFTAFLFHARHVVYESVEPPATTIRKKNVAATTDEATAETEKKPRRASTRRSGRAKGEEPVSKATETKAPEAKPVEKPIAAVAKAAAKPQAEAKPELDRSESVSKPAPAAEKPAPVAQKEWSDDEDEGAAGHDGRQFRLDDAEDSLKGLSKRERRKQRKAMKDREHIGL